MANKKQSPLILVLIMLLGVMAGYFYNSQTNNSGILNEIANINAPIDNSVGKNKPVLTLETFADMNFNFKIFENPLFQSLRSVGEDSVSPGATGRSNLFAPL